VVIDESGALVACRDEVIETLARGRVAGIGELGDDAEVDPITVALVGASHRVVVTRIAASDVRRAEVWIGSSGVLALPDAGDPAASVAVTLGPPNLAVSALVSTLGPDPSVVGARDQRTVDDLEGLCEAVLSGEDSSATVVLVGVHSIDDDEVLDRWVVVEQGGLRWAAFGGDGRSAELAPCSAVQLVGRVGALVASADASPSSIGGDQPA